MHLLRRYISPLIATWLLLGLLTACSSNSLQTSVSPTATLQPILAGGEPILSHSQIHFHDAPLPTQADLEYSSQAWTLSAHDNVATRLVTLPTCCDTPPVPLWFHSLGTPVLTTPLINSKRIYLLASDGYVHVLDAQTGEEQWRVAVGGELAANGLALAHNLVYMARDGHFLAAVDARTGQERWRFDTVGIVRAAPLVVGQLVLVSSGPNSLFCLDALSGKAYWVFHSEDTLAQFWPTRTAPIVSDDLLYVALGASNEFNALNLRTGRKVWETALHERMTGGPMLNEALGLVYIVTWSGRIVALDAHTGTQRWEAHLPGGSEASPALSQRLNTLYVGSDDSFSALDAATGQLRWRLSTGSVINAAPAVIQTATQDEVVAASEGGNCQIIDARSGKILFTWQLGELRASPVVADSMLYQASLGDRGLFAFKL